MWIPDSIYLRMMYYLTMGERLNLKHPISFSEKLQWLKLYNRKPEYTMMVDKVRVKEYVAKIIGEEYIIPTLGVWNNPEEIDFDILPNQFVLKCNHNSGLGMCLCKDKLKINKALVVKKMKKGLKENYYIGKREWPYKNMPRKILAEVFLSDLNNSELKDYKFFCFNGIAKYCQVIANRSTDETIDFYDRKWVHQDFIGLLSSAHHAPSAHHVPLNYDKMLQIADKMSSDVKSPFVRVDLYNVNGKIYFGEITFFPFSGFGEFRPKDWNRKLGDMIKLPIDV